jgi:radical SAM protein with 4Fe4S-binding SPASM domain
MAAPLLKEIDLHLTNRCNLRCTFCCFDSGQMEMGEMGSESLCRLLEEARDLGAEELHITGGEPFLREDLFEILQKGVDLGFRVRLQSNGTLLTPVKTRRLKRLGVLDLMVSLDGLETTHDRLRGCKGVYQRTLRGARMAVENGMRVRINSVVFRENVGEMAALLQRTVEIGASVHSFFYLTPFGRGRELTDQGLSGREWLTFIDGLRTRLNEIPSDGTQVIVEKAFLRESEVGKWEVGCKAVEREHALILCDGRVFPCVLFLHSPFSLGNADSIGLGATWRESGGWEFYEALTREACPGCERSPACGGGCMGYRHLFGDPLHSRFGCDRADGIISICPTRKLNLGSSQLAPSSVEAMEPGTD